MKEYVVHLSPLSSIESTLSSDTLFGALCWAVRTLYGETRLEEVLRSFHHEPPFLVGSAFPCRSPNGHIRYFLPKPKYPPLHFSTLATLANEDSELQEMRTYHSRKAGIVEVSRKYKRFRKVEWITLELFGLVAGKGMAAERILFVEYLKNRLPHQSRETREGVQKNTIDRLMGSTAGAGNTFYNQETFFPSGHGLYFLLRTNDIAFVAPSLRFLEDAGIGANARTGKNRFRIRWYEFDVTVGKKGSSFVTLSRTIPESNTDWDKSFYELEPVRSKVESREEFAGEDVWKDAVTYLKEGSIITPQDSAAHVGGIFPVKQLRGKTIYQYGCAYPFWGDFSKEGSP